MSVLRLVSDENFDGILIRELLRRLPNLDLVRVVDAGLASTADPLILDWAAAHGRILLKHDRNTIPGFAFGRVPQAQPVPGVVVVDDRMPVGQAIDDLALVTQWSEHDEWIDRVTYFPL
jgi:hypothetical protein